MGGFPGKGKGAFEGGRGAALHEFRDGTSSTLLLGERPPPDSLQAGRWYSGHYILEPSGGPDALMRIPSAKWPYDFECQLAGSQYGPGDLKNPCDRYHFWSFHSGGANFAFADGSVRFVPYTARDILPALATRDGGETLTDL
jgi:prepilin-type processing-associated H-X9-DG protein